MYVFYHHRNDSRRELVMSDGAEFPRHLRRQDWYLHATTHASVYGRTKEDIAMLGFCDRAAGTIFGRKPITKPHPELVRKGAA